MTNPILDSDEVNSRSILLDPHGMLDPTWRFPDRPTQKEIEETRKSRARLNAIETQIEQEKNTMAQLQILAKSEDPVVALKAKTWLEKIG